MIKKYIGTYYLMGKRDEEHRREATEADGLFHGVCDVCGGSIEDDDVGEIVSTNEWEIKDTALEEDWCVIGKNLICPVCQHKVKKGEMDIFIVNKDIVRFNNALIEEKARLANEYLDFKYSITKKLNCKDKLIDEITNILSKPLNVSSHSFDMQGNTMIYRSGEEVIRMIGEIGEAIRKYKEEEEIRG